MFSAKARRRARAYEDKAIKEVDPGYRHLAESGLLIGIALLVPFIALGAGAIASFETENWKWFARSGSVALIVGIVLVLRDIDGALVTKAKVIRSLNRTQTQEEFRKEVTEIKLWHRNVEALLLIVGTVVTVWGDLGGCLYSANICQP